MKKLIYVVVFITLVLTLSGCDNSDSKDCDTNEKLTDGQCVDTNTPNTPNANTDNLFKLNIGNTDGWELYPNNNPDILIDIIDGSLTFTQSNKDNDSTWDRKLTYSTMDIDGTKDYTIDFNAIGSEYEVITIYIQSGSSSAFYEKEFVLSGSNQSFTLDIVNPETVVGSGIFVIGLGTFSNGSTVTISNIEITEKVKSDKLNILFIGNSFTYYNDMPKMVEQMGLSNGYDVNVESIANGGYSLIQYMTVGTVATKQVIDKLNEKEFDYVILQEHSSKPDTNKTEFLYSVEQLNQLITSNGAQTILYSTWSYRDGSDKLASTGYTYTEFYNSLTNAYTEAAETNNVFRAPVGTAFYNITMNQSEINLLRSDDFHPNTTGSYVAAYTFYTMIFGEETNNDYIPTGLSLDTVSILRTYALEALDIEE